MDNAVQTEGVKASEVDMTGWSPQQIEEYKTLQADMEAEEEQLELLDAEQKAWESSPEYQLEKMRLDLDAKKQERAERVRKAEEDKAWADLQDKHGAANLARHDTASTMIVLLCPTASQTAVLKAKANRQGVRPEEKDSLVRGYIRGQVLYPDKDKFEVLVGGGPVIPGQPQPPAKSLVWEDLMRKLEDLASDLHVDFQKKVTRRSRR